jgi:Ni,Fe-hydrogenase III large subunit
VAVGPVHAGVIEPGHFRFQCFGETVFHLEISLGYQHRGVERALVGGPDRRTVHLLETAAGDTTVGHATALAMNLEALSGTEAPPRAAAIRAIALELERLACHTGDLGALADDVGYLPTASFCGRLRGEYLNATAAICGSRFGRALVRAGGVQFDIEAERAERMARAIETAVRETVSATDLLWDSPSVQARFEGTGPVSRETAVALGLVGPAARACGVDEDVRRNFPAGFHQGRSTALVAGESGDVNARARVRAEEIRASGAFVVEQLRALPDGALKNTTGGLAPRSLAVSMVEGWRGRCTQVAITDEAGRFARYKVVDPSFHNWIGLAVSLRNQQISDFPLCNKSFNLSYCGHDL